MLGGNCTHIISSLAGGELRLDAATSMSMSIELSTSAVIKNAGAVDGGSKNESAAVKAPATAAKDDEINRNRPVDGQTRAAIRVD